MSAGLTVVRVTSPIELAGMAAECAALARRMQPRLPFATAGWLDLWWRHYHEDRLLVRDQFYVHAVRNARGSLVALAPLVLTERPGNGPLRARSVTFFGSDKNVTELRGLICAPEDEGAVTRVLLDHFDRSADEWDYFTWHGVRRGSEAYAVLDATKHFAWRREATDFLLELPPSWEEFRATRSRNIKESLRKCYNSLKRAGLQFEFRAVSDPVELTHALNRFFVLHKRRSQAPHLVRHEDVFANSQARRLLFDLAALNSETAQLRAFELTIGGSVVASRLGFLLEDELYLYFSGYEPDWGAFSVMTTTVAESIKWAIEQGCKCVNLSPGTDVSKTRWGASTVIKCEGVLSPTRRGRVAFGMVSRLHEHSKAGTLLGKMVHAARRHG